MSDIDQTISWYDANAEAFADGTLSVDMESLYKPFLALLKPGSKILDAGCGAGRDALHFKNLGYDVSAFDASTEMVSTARKVTGLGVRHMRFQDLDTISVYDGIWCCASLLHVPASEIDAVLTKLAQALRPDGVMYLSFKYGDGEEVRDGRFFNSYDEARFAGLVSRHPNLQIAEQWITHDLRPGKESERWLNAILSRSAG